MQYDELVHRVQDQGGFDSRVEAISALRATLSTLGERLYRTERRHLASQLPPEAKSFLQEYVDPEMTRQDVSRFNLEEFYGRVGARADVTLSHAIDQTKAVISVLRDILPEGEWDHIKGEMPDDYQRLF